ncbi:MAG: hypothetical protein KIT33_15430 [Candidatus Kapabacteria bacterium]|nr:hypothetical protein [Ignavibacteriota bacterium]MCW5886361.1 hypothetical protein [Candidatus Kapabacteria bacterium]
MILEERNKIKELLEQAFEIAGLKPYISITSFPKNDDAMDELIKQAKSYSNGCMFVTWHSEHPGQKVGKIYPYFIDIYTVFLISSDLTSDEDIIKRYELARDTLQKKYYLYFGEKSPVRSSKNGLYVAALQVGTQNIYQGVS